jgi:hypothetical protein
MRAGARDLSLIAEFNKPAAPVSVSAPAARARLPSPYAVMGHTSLSGTIAS